jgi:hypothetical protein
MSQWGQDTLLWLFVFVTLQVFRVAMVLRFVPNLAQLGASEIAAALLMAARFDAVVASCVILPSALLGLAIPVGGAATWAARVRPLAARTYLGLASIAFAVDYGFFREFHDQLDHRVFDL